MRLQLAEATVLRNFYYNEAFVSVGPGRGSETHISNRPPVDDSPAGSASPFEKQVMARPARWILDTQTVLYNHDWGHEKSKRFSLAEGGGWEGKQSEAMLEK